jgi:hypothetical protein
MGASNTLSELARISETLSNPFLEEWKNQGKKVFGYNCSYFP